jgi:hypothetical protein
LFKAPLVFIISLLLFLGFDVDTRADQEAGNHTYVTASEYGQFYAKSIPYGSYGLKGVTKVYQVDEKEDSLIQTYPWYSPRIFLEGFTGTQTVYVVQLGPWHRGHKASHEHHAIAFYKNDTLLKKYSTLDIVGSAENVSLSVSHYTVFAKILGFRRPFGNQLVFDVEGHNGELLSFDTETGALLTNEEEDVKKRLYEARVRIGQIKWRWYEKNKGKMVDINEFVITEEILRQFAPTDFPDLPLGHRYLPGTMWKPIRFQGE